MKFPGVCIVCKQGIKANDIGLWSKGEGVKHEKCAQTDSIQCSVCGAPAGCNSCEFQDNCDIQNVSQLCICKKCSQEKDAWSIYQKSISKKFPFINNH